MSNETQVQDQEVKGGELVISDDVVKADAVTPAIFEESGAVMFSTIKATDRATQVKLYNAINGSDLSLGDHLGDVIEISDMVAHSVELTDELTGDPFNALRVVLVTPEGEAYHAVSQGVVSSLQKIIGVVGQGPWSPALKVVPTEVKTRKGFKTLTLRLQA